MKTFVGRNMELESLKSAYRKEGATLVVVNGRRRTGNYVQF